MRIRPADLGDVDLLTSQRLSFIADVRDLDRTTLLGEFEAVTDAFVRSSLTDGVLHAWLAEDETGACIGTVALLLQLVPPRPTERRTNEGYIINMYVVPSERGRGVGRALLETCLACGEALHISRFTLHATALGHPLYEALGFVTNADWLELRLPPAD